MKYWKRIICSLILVSLIELVCYVAGYDEVHTVTLAFIGGLTLILWMEINEVKTLLTQQKE